MPFDRRHVLAQWGGTLPGGEIWSNSLRLASTDTGPDADVPDHDAMVEWLTTYAKDAVAAWHGSFDLKCSNQAKLAYPVSYTHLRAHETGRNLVCRLLLEK